MAKFTQDQLRSMGLSEHLPKHVAIIMDGNGRWAQARKLRRTLGHRAGVERLHDIIRFVSNIGVSALSLYAFSTENWKRPSEEVNALCSLLVEYFQKEIEELHAQGVCIRALGVQDPFPASVREAVRKAQEKTANNTGLQLSIALNYGGQNELLRAVRKVAADVAAGEIAPADIIESTFESYLDTAGLPMVDFLIRTGGEQRISNFLLYQSAYAEMYFMDEYWPDFNEQSLIKAFMEFQRRSRRYGGL